MFVSEAEHMIRRALEETKAEFTDEQVQALAMAMTKICSRVIEEALASWRPSASGGPSGKPTFFAD